MKSHSQVSCRTLFLLAALLLTAGPAHGQATGRIVGRVLDGETGAGLANVSLAVEGTSAGTLSGLDGRYIIHGVPAGPVTIRAESIGYGSKAVTAVVVPAGGAVEQNITLDPAAVALTAIAVTAGAEQGSASRAVEMQRTAAGVMNAISAEQIARSPDGDAGAAVQRVSGVTVQDGKYVFVRGLGERYTTTSLNGARIPSAEPERRAVPLDLFPAGLLEHITTTKTFTPNLPGDFSGALVDIRTREYPGTQQWTLSLSQGMNSVATGRMLPMAPTAGGEWVAAAAGPRALPDIVRDTRRPQPGTQTNALVNGMRNAWSVSERRGMPATSFGISLGGTDPILGHDIGYLFSGTYSLADEAQVDGLRENVEGDRYEGMVGRQSVLMGGLMNMSALIGTHSRVVLNNSWNRTADNEARLESGFYENHATNIRIERLKYVERAVRSHQLQLQHQLSSRQRLDWSVNLSSVSRQEPDRSEFVTWLDTPTPTWYNQEGAFRAYGGLTEAAHELSLNYALQLGAARSSALRLGGLIRSTARDAYDTGYSIRSREWTPTDERWQAAAEQIFDGRYSSNGERLFELGIFNAGGNYEADDRLLAAYSMLELSLTPSMNMIAGARWEQSDVEVRYQDILGTEGVSAPSWTDVLPAVALTIDLTQMQKLRLSASQTLSRPEYREIAPICYRAGLGEEQRCGNPELSRTLIRNFDARWEHYAGAGEVLSLALFAKRFIDPIEPRYQGRSGTNSLWFENASSALNYGVELEAVRNLGVISYRLEPLSLFSNVTLMKSEVDTGNEGDEPRAMTGQAPYVVNAGLTWAAPAGSTTATVLFNVVGERIINARPSGSTVQNMVEKPRPGLDLSLRFPLLSGVSGKLDLKNLLDAPYEVTQGDLKRAYYRTGRTAAIGVSWRR